MNEQVTHFRRTKLVDGRKLYLLSHDRRALINDRVVNVPATILGLAGTVEIKGLGTTPVRTILKKNSNDQWRLSGFSHSVTEGVITEVRSFIATKNTQIGCWIDHVKQTEDATLGRRAS